jgi:hypothetical protein
VSARLSALVVLVMLLGLLAACGGSSDKATATVKATTASASPTAGSAQSSPKPIQPTATATEAASPTVGVTGANGTPVVVDALWVYNDGTSVAGGTSTVKVTVKKKDDSDLRVGFFESEVGGTGAQWQAAGWMSVITSSLLLGQDPSHYEFSFDTGGRIDGPSAGALMTSAVLAAYLGDTINPDVTMTGTINPDGTIGPVGGIPNKLEGAQAAGKKVVLVPGGQRYDVDEASGDSVDLVETGQKLGITVKLVPDIFAAYKELTGKDLPQPESGPKPDLPQAAFDKYRAGTTNWIAKYQSQKGTFQTLPADVQSYRQSIIDAADYYAGKADQYTGEGQIASAYEASFKAAAYARVANEAAQLDNLYNSSGVDALVQKVNASISAETRFNAVSQRIEAETPRTSTDALAILDAYSNLSIAQGLIFQAQDAIQTYVNNQDATEDDLLTTVYTANYDYVYADLYLDVATDSLDNGMGFGSSPAPNLDVLKAISETLRRGAEANINYFEALVIDPWAQDNNIRSEIAKYYFQQYDSDYLTAVAAVSGAESLASGTDKPDAQASINLGASLTAYSRSAGLIAKYYSLGAQVDDSGNIVGYDRESSLADMLDLADGRAKQLLGSVSTEEPIQAIYYYDNARLLRQGEPTDQLTALTYYWNSAVLSEALGIFTTTPK